jgi:hypothetical protein
MNSYLYLNRYANRCSIGMQCSVTLCYIVKITVTIFIPILTFLAVTQNFVQLHLLLFGIRGGR